MLKQKLTLSVDKEIISQAKSQNINLSSFLEIRLIDYLSDKEQCSRRDLNPSLRLERPGYESSRDIAQPVLHTYMVMRRLEGISDRWAYDINTMLQRYLSFVDWKIDKDKTLVFLEQLQSHYSVTAYRKRLYQIRKFLQHLGVRWADNLTAPPEPVPLPKRITSADVIRTFHYFDGHQYELQMKAVVALGACTGVRPEELYQLTRDDIDVSERFIRINHNPDSSQTTKTGESRVIVFNKDAQQKLQRYLCFFNNGCSLQLLFGQKHIERNFRHAPLRVKDLRKFFSQEWDRCGGPTSIKKLLMGHSGDVDLHHYNAQNEVDLRSIYDQVGIQKLTHHIPA